MAQVGRSTIPIPQQAPRWHLPSWFVAAAALAVAAIILGSVVLYVFRDAGTAPAPVTVAKTTAPVVIPPPAVPPLVAPVVAPPVAAPPTTAEESPALPTPLEVKWNEVLPSPVGSIRVDPSNPNVVYATMEQGPGVDVLWKSENGGDTWKNLGKRVWGPGEDSNIFDVQVSGPVIPFYVPFHDAYDGFHGNSGVLTSLVHESKERIAESEQGLDESRISRFRQEIEKARVAEKALPGFKAGAVSAAKAPNNPNIILVAISSFTPGPHRVGTPNSELFYPSRLFLSLDGEKSWQEILLPNDALTPGPWAPTVAVSDRGGSIKLFIGLPTIKVVSLPIEKLP